MLLCFLKDLLLIYLWAYSKWVVENVVLAFMIFKINKTDLLVLINCQIQNQNLYKIFTPEQMCPFFFKCSLCFEWLLLIYVDLFMGIYLKIDRPEKKYCLWYMISDRKSKRICLFWLPVNFKITTLEQFVMLIKAFSKKLPFPWSLFLISSCLWRLTNQSKNLWLGIALKQSWDFLKSKLWSS